MTWLFDNIPWWVYPMLAAGGGGALLALVPGALAFVVGIYNAMPVWLRWLTGAAIIAALAHVAGRNIGRRNARAEQDAVDRRARQTAKETTDEVGKLAPSEVDKRLEESGGFFDDPPSAKGGTRRRV